MLSELEMYIIGLGSVILVIGVAGAFFAVVGLVHGLNAMQAVRGHPNALSLRLAALNLLEPSVTIMLTSVFFAVPAYALLANSTDVLNWLLIPLILQGLMLLAPFFAPAAVPAHKTIAVWGGLRWINTVLLWLVGFASWALGFSAFSGTNIAIALAASGVVILWLSIRKLVPILRELQAVEKA